MRRGERAGALVAVVAGCAWAALGCSDDGDTETSGAGAQRVDEVASGWGETDPKDEQRTRTYLSGQGDALLEYADFAARLEERVTNADQCGDLRGEWEAAFARRSMVNRLYALPDPILGRLWTSQIPSAERAVRACASGDAERSAAAAQQVADLQELVDRRLEQLEVER